jgi:hypothetical protein
MNYPGISIEGAILSPDVLDRLDNIQGNLIFQEPMMLLKLRLKLDYEKKNVYGDQTCSDLS